MKYLICLFFVFSVFVGCMQEEYIGEMRHYPISQPPYNPGNNMPKPYNIKGTNSGSSAGMFLLSLYASTLPIAVGVAILSANDSPISSKKLKKLHDCLGATFKKENEEKLLKICPFKPSKLLQFYKDHKAYNPEDIAKNIKYIEKSLKSIEKNKVSEEKKGVLIEGIRERLNGNVFREMRDGEEIDWLGNVARAAIFDRLLKQKIGSIDFRSKPEIVSQMHTCFADLFADISVQKNCENILNNLGVPLDIVEDWQASIEDIYESMDQIEKSLIEAVGPLTKEFKRVKYNEIARFFKSIQDKLNLLDVQAIGLDILGKRARKIIDDRLFEVTAPVRIWMLENEF